MSRFIESLAYENGSYPLLAWHQQRVNDTYKAQFDDAHPLQLEKILPFPDVTGLQKVRVLYDVQDFEV